MNEKGFAATSILYTILVLFILLLSGVITMLYSRSSLLETIKKQVRNDIGQTDYCTSMVGYHWDYSGPIDAEKFVVPCTGTYKIELWGASGGSLSTTNQGGLGAYTSGTINFDKDFNFFIYVGSQGYADPEASSNPGGYNGGGYSGIRAETNSSGGGGATDIRLSAGVSWNYFDSLKSRIMVAAGGGGTTTPRQTETYTATPGNAGGLTGYSGAGTFSATTPTGATQTSTGTGSTGEGVSRTGFFGYALQTAAGGWGGGGGSGYYGGVTGYGKGGSGGSSFISGHEGCDAIAEESTIDKITHTKQSVHYSNKLFSDTVMIDGSGYKWTTVKGSNKIGQTQPDGSLTDGHSGDGYARITLVTIN